MRIAPSAVGLVLAVSVFVACKSPPRQTRAPAPSATVAKVIPSPALSAASAAAAAGSGKPQTPGLSPLPPDSVPAPADVAAPPADALRTPSGLASKVLKKGTGKDHPTQYDQVRMHYTGWTKDGRMFDNSRTRDSAVVALAHVIKGWSEGLPMMVAGEQRRFWIPAGLAYGAFARGGAPAGDLTYDIELLGIIPGTPPPNAPADVAAPPPTAIKTESGLTYRFLSHGGGPNLPLPNDRVTFQFSAWTPDGKLWDTSLSHGKPVTMAIQKLPRGWAEGIQLMKVGDKIRLWMPAELAWGEHPPQADVPAGPLVMDIELVSILPSS